MAKEYEAILLSEPLAFTEKMKTNGSPINRALLGLRPKITSIEDVDKKVLEDENLKKMAQEIETLKEKIKRKKSKIAKLKKSVESLLQKTQEISRMPKEESSSPEKEEKSLEEDTSLAYMGLLKFKNDSLQKQITALNAKIYKYDTEFIPSKFFFFSKNLRENRRTKAIERQK